MANQVFHFSNTGITSGQRFYLKDDVSGIFVRNLNIDSNFPITADNLVYNTGNQIISGDKTFLNNIYVSGTGIFNSVDLSNISEFQFSGVNISLVDSTIALSGVIFDPDNFVYTTGDQDIFGIKKFDDDVYISGNPGRLYIINPSTEEYTSIRSDGILVSDNQGASSFYIGSYSGNYIWVVDNLNGYSGVLITTTPDNSNTVWEWYFRNDGNLVFPDYTVQNTAFSNPYPNTFYLTGVSNPSLELNDGTSLADDGLFGGFDKSLYMETYDSSVSAYQGILINPSSDNAINIYTENPLSINNWYFTKSGELVFPDSTKQITAFTGIPDDIVYKTGYQVINGDKRFQGSGIFDGGLYVGSNGVLNSYINLWEGNVQNYYNIRTADGGIIFGSPIAGNSDIKFEFVQEISTIYVEDFFQGGKLALGYNSSNVVRDNIPSGNIALTYETNVYNHNFTIPANQGPTKLTNKKKFNKGLSGIFNKEIRTGDYINLFPLGQYNKGQAWALSDNPSKALGRTIPINTGIYSGKYLHRVKTHPTIRNNFVNMILSSGTGQWIKPKERFLETHYNIEVPANSGALRPLQFLTPRFSIANNPILNLTFNFEQNSEQPVVSGCYAYDPSKVIFTLTGSNSYSFSQTIRMMYRRVTGVNDGIKDGYIIL